MAIFLKQALDSILAQTFKDFELLISDNGSTDRTEEICRAYAANDQRICYYRHEQNLGAGWNQSRVVELSEVSTLSGLTMMCVCSRALGAVR